MGKVISKKNLSLCCEGDTPLPSPHTSAHRHQQHETHPAATRLPRLEWDGEQSREQWARFLQGDKRNKKKTASHHDFFKVADEDTEGGFLIATGSGMGDGGTDHQWGSWNCSGTLGPLGEICALPRGPNQEFGIVHCYDSCGSCDPHNSCDWTSCYDDILYTEAVIDQVGGGVFPNILSTLKVADLFCVDLDNVHQTGMSNGGIFSYFLASRCY